jgi:hypothetical protein
MTLPRTDNGEWMMRAQREAHNPFTPPYLTQAWREYLSNPQAEPEDTTGLRLLDEFLAKRKGARDD